MKRFKNILVGVDLSERGKLVADTLPEASAEAIDQALWLAKLNEARVTFLYCFEVPDGVRTLILEGAGEPPVLEQAQHALEVVVQQASRQRVDASCEIAFGKGWVELIRRVLSRPHDLVVVGTRDRPAISRALFGSTNMKLLRKCPCPVWVTKPAEQPTIRSVLVAHDLTPVGTLALRLGASMSALRSAKLHVLHAIEHAEYDWMLPSSILATTARDRRNAAHAQIDAELTEFQLASAPTVTVTDTDPSAAILRYLNDAPVDLLVMGTVARAGVEGVITGNTAERLLPNIPCSVLAVKPTDFVSPLKPPV